MNLSKSTKFASFLCDSVAKYTKTQFRFVLTNHQNAYTRLKKLTFLQGFGTQVGIGVLLASSALSWTICKPVLAISFTKKSAAEQVTDSKIAKVLDRADALYDQVKYEELYTLLMQFKDEDSDELLWRLARATFEKSKLESSKEEKVKLLRQAKEYVYKSLSLNETNFAGHKWASILVVELAEHEGTKAKIQQSVVSKEHMLRAHALNPKDGTTLYLLGVWSFTFADLSWHQRKLASVLFASPPSSSYEEALTYFKKAEEVEPNFYSMNLLMLGKSYLKLNEKELAINYLKKARDYLQKTDEDKQAQNEAMQILKSLGLN